MRKTLPIIFFSLTLVSLSVTNITPTSTTLPQANFLTSVSVLANGYEYYYSTSNPSPVATTLAIASFGISVNSPSLTPETTHDLWVKSGGLVTDKVS